MADDRKYTIEVGANILSKGSGKMKKPMLACPVEDIEQLKFPLLLSPKLDGIRALVIDGVVMSRSLKPIPNQYVQSLFGHPDFNGLDGELIVGETCGPGVFERTQSGVMSIKGLPDVRFYAFDDYLIENGFRERHASVARRTWAMRSRRVSRVPHYPVDTIGQLNNLENEYVEGGYEGIMLRHVDGPYKEGRSTFKEGWLMKLKRFKDGEAMILSAQELMHNDNEAMINELGQKSRSSKKAGMVGAGTLGALHVVDLKTGVYFDIGTGFSARLKDELWRLYDIDMQNGLGWLRNPRESLTQHPGRLLGRIVKYKYQEVGVKDKPRFPVYHGFRDPIDL